MMIKIAERIKMLREATKLTQAELAKQLSITRSSVNAWEMGISIPSTQFLIEMALLFNVSTDYLLGMKNNQQFDLSDLTDDEMKIIYDIANHFRKHKFTVN